MKTLIIRVWEYSLNNPNGFTLNLESFTEVKKGISVAFKETQNSFGLEGLEKVLNHAIRNDNKVGGWLSQEKYYFDSVKIFFDLEAAIRFAVENEQEAIYYIDLKLEIKIKK